MLLNGSVMSNPFPPLGLYAARLLSLWDFPGKNTGVGCHFLSQGIFPTQGSNLHLLHRRRILDHWATSKAQWWDICHIILILILWRGEEVAVEIEKYEALTFFPGGWPALEEDVSRFFFPFPFWLRAFTCAIPSALYASPPTYWVNPYSSFRTQLKASLPQRCLPRLPWFGNTFTRHA